jgi:hypothetical protein
VRRRPEGQAADARQAAILLNEHDRFLHQEKTHMAKAMVVVLKADPEASKIFHHAIARVERLGHHLRIYVLEGMSKQLVADFETTDIHSWYEESDEVVL